MLNRTRMIGPCQNAAWFFYVPATAPGSSVKRRSVSSLGLEALLLFSPTVWQRESCGLASARSVILLFALVSERLRASPTHGGDARGGRRHLSVGLLVRPSSRRALRTRNFLSPGTDSEVLCGYAVCTSGLVPQVVGCAANPSVTPGRILAGHPHGQLFDRRGCPGATHLPVLAAIIFLRD